MNVLDLLWTLYNQKLAFLWGCISSEKNSSFEVMRPILMRPPPACLPSGPCTGDASSSSPGSTPMGSIESLSSHSSEHNGSSKAETPASVQAQSARLPDTASLRSSGPRSTESSSKEDPGPTDVESEDALLTASSVTGVAPKKAPHQGHPEPRPPDLTATTSLKSLRVSEGNFQTQQRLNFATPSHLKLVS